MEIDIKKVMGSSPKDGFEAVDKMNKAQQELLEALHIMQSAIEFQGDDYTEIHNDRMKKYLSKFCKTNEL